LVVTNKSSVKHIVPILRFYSKIKILIFSDLK
jgi:hypothetical protein